MTDWKFTKLVLSLETTVQGKALSNPPSYHIAPLLEALSDPHGL